MALAAALLAAVIAVAFGGVAGGLSAIGGTDAPAVTAATGLYFSLNDMDAQVANIMLAAAGPALAGDRPQYLATYDADRADGLRRPAAGGGHRGRERGRGAATAPVLVNAGKYEALAADALLPAAAARRRPARRRDHAGRHAAARQPGAAVGYYRQATDLMRTAILPRSHRWPPSAPPSWTASYAAGRSDAGAGAAVAWPPASRWPPSSPPSRCSCAAVPADGQPRARRRRRLAVALACHGAARLGAEASHLAVAKQDAFDSVVARQPGAGGQLRRERRREPLPRRPGPRCHYQQSFLAESQELASVGNVPLARYEPALAADFAA